MKSAEVSLNDMGEIRSLIDAIDGEILVLLKRRAALALEIGRLKAESGRPVYDPEREAEILERLARQDGCAPLPPEAVKKIFAAVMESCREIQTAKF